MSRGRPQPPLRRTPCNDNIRRVADIGRAGLLNIQLRRQRPHASDLFLPLMRFEDRCLTGLCSRHLSWPRQAYFDQWLRQSRGGSPHLIDAAEQRGDF